MDVEGIKTLKERLLLCSICMNEFTDPRILPCHHTFCLKCISSIYQSDTTLRRRRLFCCPHCRRNFDLSAGVDKLPQNFYLTSLQDELLTTEIDGECDICSRELAHLQFYCHECDIDICRYCISAHRLKAHEKTPNIDRFDNNSSLSTSTNSCETHVDERIQLFCVQCQQAICIVCSCSDHKRHDVVPLAKQMQTFKSSMLSELDKINQELDLAEKSKIMLGDVEKDIQNASDNSLEMLNDAAMKACDAIMKRKLEIEQEIKFCNRQNSGLNEAEGKLEKYTDMLSKGQDFLSNLQDDEMCMEAVESFNEYLSKVKTLRAAYQSSLIQIKQTHFQSWNNIKLLDFGFSSVKTVCVLGRLGSLKTEHHTKRVRSDTLEIVPKDRFFSLSLFKKSFKLISISLILICSFCFIGMNKPVKELCGPTMIDNIGSSFLSNFFIPE